MEKKLFARYPVGNPKRKWKQDNFILSVSGSGPSGLYEKDPVMLERTRKAVVTAQKAGFTLQEMLWASPEVGMEIIRTAERIGAKVSYQNLRRFGGMGFSKTSYNEDNDLLGAIRETRQYDSVVSYYVYDEPTNDKQRRVTREMIELMERECPEKLPYTVAAARPDYVNDLADEVCPAQLSFDVYPFGNIEQELDAADQLDRANFWYYMENARRAAKRIEAPFWFYYQGHALFYKPSFDRYTFDASRMMANAAILHGAKQISAYVEFDGFVDPATGGPGVHFAEQKRLNEETANLGNTLMALECLRVIHDGSLKIETKHKEAWEKLRFSMADSEYLEGELPRRISVSELRDEYGHRYLLVLNRDYRSEAHFSLKLKEPSNVYRTSPEDGEERLVFLKAAKLKGHLSPGSVALYRLQSASEEPYTLEYYLEKPAKKGKTDA